MNEVVKGHGSGEQGGLSHYICLGLSFNFVKSPYFKNVVEAIVNFGNSYASSYQGASVTCLKKDNAHIYKVDLERYRKEWSRTECTS